MINKLETGECHSNFRKVIVLKGIVILLLLSSLSFAHKGVLVNTKQTIFIQPTSIKISHVLDCGLKSSLNIIPLLDANNDGKIEDDEINALSIKLKEAVIKYESDYKALLDKNTISLPFQKLAIHYDSTGNNTNVEIIFSKNNLFFKEGLHKLTLEREGFHADIPILMAMIGYSSTPLQAHSPPAHMVGMELRIPDNFKILESSLGFIPSNSPSLLKGIFLTQQHPKVEVSFEVKSPDSSHK